MLNSSRVDTITDIYLAFGNLDEIPIEILNFPNLKKINISHNNFTNKDLDILLKIKSLQEIDLSHNQITEIPDNLDKLKKLENFKIYAN